MLGFSIVASVLLFHLLGTSVYADWAKGSLFIWCSKVWQYESAGTINSVFGYAIPLVALWFIYTIRKPLLDSPISHSWWGLPLVLFMLLLHGVGLRGQLPHLSSIAFIGLLWSLILATMGMRIASRIKVPIAYLLLAVPMGFVERITFPMRHLASVVSSLLLNGVGISVVRNGTAILATDNSFALDVADPCSGIRSMMALVALGAAFAYLAKLKLIGKWVLFASCVPIAFVANVTRIFLLALAAKYLGSDFAFSSYHDVSAYIVFIVATILLTAMERFMSKHYSIQASACSCAKFANTTGENQEKMTPTFCAVLALIFLMATPYSLKMKEVSLMPAAPDLTLPDHIASWEGERVYFSPDSEVSRVFYESELDASHTCPETGLPLLSASPLERIGLPQDTEIIKSVYRHPSGSEVMVSVVKSGESRGSIHKPQWCLAAQGYSIITTEHPTWRQSGDQRVALLQIKHDNNSIPSQLCCYWFIGDKYSTPFHSSRVLRMASERLIKGHATRWSYVLITTPDSPLTRSMLKDYVNELDKVIAGEL